MARIIAMIVLSAFTACQLVGAVPGPSSATGNFRNPKDTMGLCVPEHKEEAYYKMGHCKTVFESFTKEDSCVKKKLEEIRLRFIGKPVPGATAQQMQQFQQKGMNGMFGCFNNKQNMGIREIAEKDSRLFAYLMMQFISAVVIEESDWDIKNGGKGLMNISKAQMDDPKYACGCDIANSQSRGGTPAGESPGEIDGHQSIQCGAYMALYHASEDGELFSGTEPPPGTPKDQDPRKGAAKIFKSLVSKEDPAHPGEEANPALKRIKDKIQNFCDKTTFVNTWNPELMPDTDIQGLRN